MKFFAVLGIGMLLTLSGCVGLPPKAAPAHIYSSSEKLMPGPWQGLDVDGEAGYCAEVYSAKVFGGASKGDSGAQLRKDALTNIGKACGGEDSYHVVRDSASENAVTYYGAGGLIASKCDYGSSRIIYFKCKGSGNKPSANPKSR
jgi:hypothetical protein